MVDSNRMCRAEEGRYDTSRLEVGAAQAWWCALTREAVRGTRVGRIVFEEDEEKEVEERME